MRKSTLMLSLVLCASAQTLVSAQEVHNWTSASGAVWRDASGRCWRDASWTAQTAAANCDGAVTAEAPVVAKQVAAPVAAPVVAAAPVPAAAPAVAPMPAPVQAKSVTMVSKKIKLEANAFFDTNKAELKAAGKAKLDALAAQLKSLDISTIVATGYTDASGTEALNNKLSAQRADAVKTYLAAKGIAASKMQAVGKGSADPIADNKSKAGRAQNRRVEIEVQALQSAN